MDGVDLQYSLISNMIKENVIFNSIPGISTITEQIKAKGLTLILNADGSIDAVDEITNEKVFIIPATFLVDSEGNECVNIAVSLTRSGNKYTITYTLDMAWLEKAIYPVLFDPTVSVNTGTDGSYVIDNRIAEALPTTNYKNSYLMCTGYGSTSSTNYSLIKFTNLPTGFSGSQIYAADLKAILASKPSISSTVEAHEITSNWDANVVWNSRPQFAGTYSTVYVGTTQYVTYTWILPELQKTGTQRIMGSYLRIHPHTIRNGRHGNRTIIMVRRQPFPMTQPIRRSPQALRRTGDLSIP